MKNYLLLFFVFSISIVQSQELSEEFLQTLPQSIQNDVLSRIKKQQENVQPRYSSIETQTKLEKEGKVTSEIFGSDFFSTYQSTFMPINEPNLSSEYIIDFGDTLEIQLIGQQDFTEELQIKRDGSINMPDIGKIKIAGLSLGDAISLIKAKVSSSFIGTEVFVSLTSIRDINVLVSGNAYSPGIYTISGNSNMLHALGVAGGINKYGSYRSINLIRNQEIIESLDMYDVLITGSYNSKIKLQPGDIIFVEPVKKLVAVDGAVKRPAIYELKDGQKLSDILDYANGIDIRADMSNIFLERILDGRVRPIQISNINEFDEINAEDGDKIFIRKYPYRNVEVLGSVLKPGKYLMSEGETVEDLISKAGGYTKNAYLFGAVYEKQTALEINKMADIILYEKFIDNIISMSQNTPAGITGISPIIDLTESLKNSVPNGRIVIDIVEESSNVYISDGDKLIIPEKSDHIFIYGEVSYEGALNYSSSKSLNDYIDQSGGLKKSADEKAIYILHPNGDTQRSSIRKNLFQNSPDKELALYPGSVIFVPREIDDAASKRLVAQAYVNILGNIGIAMASLASINNNN